MQLSISLPPPVPTTPDPSAQVPHGNIPGDPGDSSGDSSDSFSQMLPPPSPQGGDAGAPKATAKPTREQEEAAAALSAGWLAALAPHLPPVAPVSLPLNASKPLSGVSGAPKSPSAGTAPSIAASAAEATASLSGTPDAALAAKGHAAASAAAKAPAVPSAPGAKPADAAQVAASATRASEAAVAPGAPPGTPYAAGISAAAAAAPQMPRISALSGGAKIAAPAAKDTDGVSSASKSSGKRFLSSNDKEVTDAPTVLGTAVAKVMSAMPSAALAERQPNAQTGFPVPAAAPASSAGNGSQQMGEAPPAVSPQGAVEAALKAAEMLSAGNNAHAVNLQFSVGNADLSLRVAMRNGTVQATFATDSAQLRSDLAHEWQSTASGDSQSSLHLAQPVFTAAGGGNSPASGDQAQRQGRESADSSFASSSRGSSFGAAGVEDDTPILPLASASSLYLQTFA